jgi:Kef-type K+ transport system membrane component KefB
MSSHDFEKFALQLTAMLIAAVFFGQLMRRFKQPAVLGEMIGGIILGPTIVGILMPEFYTWLFRSSESVLVVRDASIKLGMLFYLFIAGLDINITDIRKLGGKALSIGIVGTLLPIGVGVGVAYLMTEAFWGPVVNRHYLSFALFIGVNLGNSAIPVLSRILMDLGLLKEEIGSLIMSSAVVDDLINWMLFAIILSDIAPVSESSEMSLPVSILINILFFVAVLAIGRWLAPHALRWSRKNVSWPSGFIAFTALVILISSVMAESIGIHAFMGAFLAGIAVGQNNREAKEAHDVITHFVLSFFAPIYFVSMGMAANFVANFDLAMVVVLLVAATASKIGAVLLGARIAGMPMNRETLAIGFGMNARGATGIILANVGLANGLIDERIFVAIVVMAIVTSLMAGPMMKKLLGNRVQIGSIDPHEDILNLNNQIKGEQPVGD